MPVYRSLQAITTVARRTTAYREVIPDLLTHLDRFDINLTKLELVTGNFVEITTQTAIPAGHVDHLKLELITP